MASLAVVVTLTLSLSLPFALKPLLARWGVVDMPNDRSSHSLPAIRGVGMAPLLAFAVGSLVLLGSADTDEGAHLVSIVLVAAVLASVIGLIEDVCGLPVLGRAAAQLLLGVSVGGIVTVESGGTWWLVPIYALSFAGYINVANFMDGVDGISGTHGAVVGASFALSGALTGQLWLVGVGALIAAAFIGFLPWNLLRKGTFLGDVGSYLLGASIAAAAIAGFASGIPLMAVVGPLAVYLGDSMSTVFRRVRNGARWYEAHRSHLYQRLTDAGFSHIQSALFVGVFTAFSAGAGYISIAWPGMWLAAAFAVVLVSGSYLVSGAVIVARAREIVVQEGNTE
ncbi:Undecaprenyl-phosphate N-acetylglucosaminyl 1-phosphate transferase [Leifsonia rubra CMS 76R]|nr:Undecaprenyl-phosphate N-acetylglucosaminyl 1-phosphate transferase [Leifsonia rubra CMS 76R]